MAQVTLTIKLDLPALQKELQDAVNKIKAKLSEVGNVDIDFDLADLQKDLDKVKKQTEDIDKTTKPIKGNFKEAGLELLKWIGIATAIRGAFNFLIDSKNVARDAAEIQSKFNTVYANLKIEANAWAENFAKNVGRAKSDVKQWMAELQDTFVPLGFTRTKAMELSQSLTKLAVDVASFNNASDPEVIRDFTSALVGNHETVRKYGILITENSLKTEAESQGMKKKYDQLTELEKVQLRYNLILKGTSDAQGDAIRTADSLANQEKRQAAELKNLQEQLGNKVVPAFLLVTKATMGWLNVLNDLLGVQEEVAGKSERQAGFLSTIKNVLDETTKSTYAYRAELRSMILMQVVEVETQLQLYDAMYKNMGLTGKLSQWMKEGIFGDDGRHNAELKVKVLRDQLNALDDYEKELNNMIVNTYDVVEDTTTTTGNKIASTTKQIFDALAENERAIMDELLSEENIWIQQLADIRIGKEANTLSIIADMRDKSAKAAMDTERLTMQEREALLQSLTAQYQQHLNFVVNAALTSTASQMSFAKQLQGYMLGLLKQYLVQFIATKFAEATVHTATETEKTAATETGVLTRMALYVMEIAKSLAVAAASIVQAIASGIAYLFSAFGPFAIPMIAGMTAAAIGLFNGIKKTLGFRRGGHTGYGNPDEPAGIVHKQEHVFEADLVNKEPDKYALLHKMLRSGMTLTDIFLGLSRNLNPITEAPMALAGVNFGSIIPSRDYESNQSLNKVQSLLQSMDDRLRKIEDKGFKLDGKLEVETKIKNRDIAIATRLGNKEIEKGQT